MAPAVAYYEILEIVCACFGLALEGYAYYRDSEWNDWLYQFGESLQNMCSSFYDRTASVVPVLNSTGYFGGAERGRIRMEMFYRNATGESWYLFSEVVSIVFTALHILYSLKSKRIGKIARYGAYVHLFVFSCMVPASLLLLINAFNVENSYKIMAAYSPQCLNIIFCKEEDSLQDEVDDVRAEKIQEDLRELSICQFFWIKLVSAAFGAVHALIALSVVFCSMSIAGRYDEDAYKDGTVAEEPENFFKTVSRIPSNARLLCESSRLTLQDSEDLIKSKMSIESITKSTTTFASRYLLGKDQEEDNDDGADDESIADILITRRLSPQSLYREYKFRKVRISEMEREQNFTQDPRISQPGWDYKIVDSDYITDTGPDANFPKRVIRKPKVINYSKEVNKKAVIFEPGQQIIVEKTKNDKKKTSKDDKVSPVQPTETKEKPKNDKKKTSKDDQVSPTQPPEPKDKDDDRSYYSKLFF